MPKRSGAQDVVDGTGAEPVEIRTCAGRASAPLYPGGVTSFDALPISEYAFPGPLRDRLVAAILNGQKTATTSLLADYALEGEPAPVVGDRAVVVDSAGDPVGIEEIIGVQIVRLGDVDLAHAIAEGEGYESVAAWRVGHERFWHGVEYRDAVGDPGFLVDDDTVVVLVRFRFEPA